MSKVIFIDWGIFIHRAIFAWKNNQDIPATYTCMNMIMSCLRRVGVNRDDMIMVAVDYMGSWRKQYETAYKGNRKEYRESHTEINWYKMWEDFDELLLDLEVGTDWQILKKEHLEADDWMAVGCKYFSDKEVILITYDKDLEQCWAYKNVKIFSPHPKSKTYKIKPKNFNPYKIIAKKIEKEASDNLVKPILNTEEYDNRRVVIDLLNLPDFVENPILKTFEKLKPKKKNLSLVPFKSIREKIRNIYEDKQKIITYEEVIKKKEKKATKKKAKKKKKR